MNKQKLTYAEQTEIRRLFYKEGVAAAKIMKEHHIGRSMMYRIIGGPLKHRHLSSTLNRAYS